jgi:hypothetical protein
MHGHPSGAAGRRACNLGPENGDRHDVPNIETFIPTPAHLGCMHQANGDL